MIYGDTIVAAATPLGFSGVAVVRVSGPLAFKIAREITHQNKTNDRVATLRLPNHSNSTRARKTSRMCRPPTTPISKK